MDPTAGKSRASVERVPVLDGLRGLAILQQTSDRRPSPVRASAGKRLVAVPVSWGCDRQRSAYPCAGTRYLYLLVASMNTLKCRIDRGSARNGLGAIGTMSPNCRRGIWPGILLLLAACGCVHSHVGVHEVTNPDEANQGPRALIHYWNFNEPETLLAPTYAWSEATLTIGLGPDTVLEPGTGQGFQAENARFEDEAGTHLRVNNPLGASMVLYVPSTGFRAPVLRYEARRSGQGAGRHELFYSTNRVTFSRLTEIELENEDPWVYRFDLSEQAGVDDNPNLAILIAFTQGEGGTAGNNRFDNITVEGEPLPGVRVLPQVVAPVGVKELIESGEPATIDLNEVFVDLGGDPLQFEVTVARPDAASAVLNNGLLSVQGLTRGETTVTVRANDGLNPAVPHTFRLLVHPEAYRVRDGAYEFVEWRSDEPEHSYPAHMLFLQSAVTDPGMDTRLDHAYVIPVDDYAATDSVGFPYNNTSRTRINGLASEGISFINTGRGRDLGGALLALDTRGIAGGQISWRTGTRTPNSRIYALRLQYRLGLDEPFRDLLDADGSPFVYTRHDTAGHVESFGPVELPPDAIDQPFLQLLWRYHHVQGDSGPRAELQLDDIRVVAEPSHPFDAWRSRNFEPGELLDPLISGPLADPDSSGMPNLLRFAFGLDRADPFMDALPRIETVGLPGSGELLFVHRRLLDPGPGTRYTLEIADDLRRPMTWREAVPGEDYVEWAMTTPVGDGLTEEVTLQVVWAAMNQARFLRLRVELSG
jgi:hypothetical protein